MLAQYVSGTIMPIIRSSRVLYKWLPPVVFGCDVRRGLYPTEATIVVTRVVCDPTAFTIVVKIVDVTTEATIL